MKHIFILSLMFSSLVFVGCGTPSNNGTTEIIVDTVYENPADKDFGPYTGQEYSINQIKDLYDFHITLNKIIIGNQNFGKYEDGYAALILPEYSSKWIIGDFTITAKFPTNLSSLDFGVGRQNNGGGTMFNSAVWEGKLSTGANKFGFFQDGLDVPMTGNESKNIKVIISLMDQFSGNGPYYFHIMDGKYIYDTTDKRKEVKFDLSQYLVY